jgi:hypothetical protein
MVHRKYIYMQQSSRFRIGNVTSIEFAKLVSRNNIPWEWSSYAEAQGKKKKNNTVTVGECGGTKEVTDDNMAAQAHASVRAPTHSQTHIHTHRKYVMLFSFSTVTVVL